MKTLKFAMAAAILAFAMICYAGEEPTTQAHQKKVVKITLSQAINEPGLVAAMQDQLDPSMLQDEPNGFYVGVVYYNKVVYRIYGTLRGWKAFFGLEWPSVEPAPIKLN